MSLFKREPRTVYRVYGEDEYFGHEQPAEDAVPEVPPLAPDRRPLAVGLLAAAVIGVLALITVATLGGSSSHAPRAAAATVTAPGSAEARGGGATTSGSEPGAEGASRARARVRARVTIAARPTTAASRIGRSRAGQSRLGPSQARAHRPLLEAGRASVSFTGGRPAAGAPVAAGLAGTGGEADAATPASRATAEFGFER